MGFIQLFWEWLQRNEEIWALLVPIVTFLLGRYTSYREDCREGKKELNEKFYRPFLHLYDSKHHAIAMYFAEIPLKRQNKIVELLLQYKYAVSPEITRKINELDMYFSSQLVSEQESAELNSEDKEYVENVFGKIYSYIKKEYIRNNRILYCSLSRG